MRCHLLTSNQQHYYGATSVEDAVEVPDAKARDLIAQGIARAAGGEGEELPPATNAETAAALAAAGVKVGDELELAGGEKVAVTELSPDAVVVEPAAEESKAEGGDPGDEDDHATEAELAEVATEPAPAENAATRRPGPRKRGRRRG